MNENNYIGKVVKFSGIFGTKVLGFITDEFINENNENKYKINLGFGAQCLAADRNSFEFVISDKELKYSHNEICRDFERCRLVRISLKTPSNYYNVYDLISGEEYITDNLEKYNTSEENKRIINWVDCNKDKIGIINSGKFKGKKVYIKSFINLFNYELNMSGFFVYCIPLDKTISMITLLPEQLNIKEKKEDY